MKPRLSFILMLFFIIGCTKKLPESDPTTITIGTFNIAWLGDGIEDRIPRSKKDYSIIAKQIGSSGADILAIQEIENTAALDILLKNLPGWSYKLGENGGDQNVGFIYKNDITINRHGEYSPLAVRPFKTRPGYFIEGKKGNFDFILMSVHFKSISRFDNTPAKRAESISIRREQAEKLGFWIDSVLEASTERDIILAGDFNDFPKRRENPSLTALLENNRISFLTSGLKSCKYPDWYVIDNIIVTAEAKKRLTESDVSVFDTYNPFPKRQAEKISDHCPITVRFETASPDND